MKKTCTKCGKDKDLSSFYKSSKGRDGYSPRCKDCILEDNKLYRDNNQDRFRESRKSNYPKNRDKILSKQKEWRERNPDKFKENRKANYLKHRESILEQKAKYQQSHTLEKSVYDKEYRKLNRDKIKKYKADWEKANKNNPTYKIKKNLRRRLNHALKGNLKAEHTFALLGCTIEEFKLHLESRFLEGMSWSNYGKEGWHIDHIIPCFTFDLSVEEQQRKCFHYTNQRPLWAKDNLSRQRQTWKTSKH